MRREFRGHVISGLLALSAILVLSARPASASYASIMLQQGIMLVQNNDYQKAIGVFRDLADALPRYAPAHEWLAKVYTRMGLKQEAEKEKKIAAVLQEKFGHLPADEIEELNILTTRQPIPGPLTTDKPVNPANRDLPAVPSNSFASIWLNRVIFLYLNNTYDLALRGFQDLAKSCPRYWPVHEWLAKTYEKLQLPEEAAKERQLAAEIKQKFGHLPKYLTEEPLDPNQGVRLESPSPSASAESIDNSQLEQHEQR